MGPTEDWGIRTGYGGWSVRVWPSRPGDVNLGFIRTSDWTVITPAAGAFATTSEVPPVPAGGAVEFAVDYAAGTCRVAFYTPAVAAGGFVEAPHAKMELRFVATARDGFGARPVPTAADSGVALYPAVETESDTGNVWRFAGI
jgi:hypothetical protein